MAEIARLCRSCAPAAPVSFFGGLRQWLTWRPRRPRVGRADDLPDRLRHDTGLEVRSPARDYREYLTKKIW